MSQNHFLEVMKTCWGMPTERTIWNDVCSINFDACIKFAVASCQFDKKNDGNFDLNKQKESELVLMHKVLHSTNLPIFF